MTMETEHIHDLLSQYLDAELSLEQRQRFEQHLEICHSCRKFLREHQYANKLFSEYIAEQQRHLSSDELFAYQQGSIRNLLKKEIIEHHLLSCKECKKLLESVADLEEIKLTSEEPAVRDAHKVADFFQKFWETIQSKRRLSVGFALTVIIVFLVMVLIPRPNPYADLAEISPAPYYPSEIRGMESPGWQDFLHGMEFYQAGDYQAAQPYLQKAAEIEKDNAQYQFFYGIVLLLTEQYEPGYNSLNQEIVRNSPYREEAIWLMVQALLKLNKANTAKQLLEDLIQSGGNFSDNARKLLQKIKATPK